MSPLASEGLSNSQLQTLPFFDFTTYNTTMGPSYDPFFSDNALYGANGSAYAIANRNRILSDAIPALTLAIGANPVPALSPPVNVVERNFNMNALYENGWPANRLSSSETNNWHHSDFKDVAYTFIYKLYTNWVSAGNLQ